MEDQKINLINMEEPQISTIFTCTKNTLIVDLHQYITKHYGKGKIEIYFAENQLFSGSLNLYLQKQLKGSSVYYKIDVSQKQIQSSFVNTNQDNQKLFLQLGIQQQSQSKSVSTTSYSQKLDQISQTDEKLFQNNGSQQMNEDHNMQQLALLQLTVQQLTAQLEQKEEQMKKILEEKQISQQVLLDQIQKNKEVIQKHSDQINYLNYQLNQQQKKTQLEQKEKETLQNKIEELKIEDEAKNKKINSLMKQNDITLQKKQDIEEFYILQKQVDLYEFNDNDQETAETYKNKCGHIIEKNILEQLLLKAVMNKNIARCQICNSHFSSKLCQEIGTIGKEYLQMKSAIELPDIYNSCKALKNTYQSLISCENSSCNFFCVWKPNIQQLDDDYSFCPNCLIQSVKNPKGALFYTHI